MKILALAFYLLILPQFAFAHHASLFQRRAVKSVPVAGCA
jgi:hypothetical protein